MASPEDIGNMFTSLFNNNIMGLVMKYTFYTVVAASIIAFIVMLYFWMQYKYKIKYPILLWEENGAKARIWKWKTEYARKIKVNGIIKWRLFFKKKNVQPISESKILPGNYIYVFKINNDGTFIDMPSIVKDEELKFEALTHEETSWAILELKETAESNQTEDQAKRLLNYTIVAIVLILCIVALCTWLSLKYTGNITTALNDIGPTLKALYGNIGGKPPV